MYVFIVRELAKVVMFTILWGIPVLLAHLNQNNSFLWFFILSVIFTGIMFGHYEDLEKIDKGKKCNYNKDNDNDE